MSTSRLGAIIAVLLLVGVVCYFLLKPSPPKEMAMEPGTVYYTGPSKGRNGTWGLPDGTQVPPPTNEPINPNAKSVENETL